MAKCGYENYTGWFRGCDTNYYLSAMLTDIPLTLIETLLSYAYLIILIRNDFSFKIWLPYFSEETNTINN